MIVLVDDVRWFRDARECVIARTSAAAVELLTSPAGRRIEELWLDHDLRGEDTAMPVVDLLCSRPFDIAVVWIHSFNARGAVTMHQRLQAAGYVVKHHYDVRIWTHSQPQNLSDPRVTVGDRGGSQ